MAKINIAFDHSDNELGHYFEESKKNIVDYVNAINLSIPINEIDSSRCSLAYIDIIMPTINQNNFIFLAYSHGNKNELKANGDYYIHADINSYLFTNCFFYAMACYSGIELGNKLIQNGSHFYIGFNNEAQALLGKYMQLSIECDNFGIKKVLDGFDLQNSFLQMKDNFTNQIDKLVDEGEPILAAYLRKNRDALVCFGNGGNLTKSDFFN